MTIAYRYQGSLYLNITNHCSCRCCFCIRQEADGVGDGDNLWLEHEPSFEEVRAALDACDLSQYESVVFCGYGEPTERLDLLLTICRYLREHAPGLSIRLNTNGLSDLLRGKPSAPLLTGLVDTVSISLNAPDAARYQQIVEPAFGTGSFSALLRFAEDCKACVEDVQFTLVDVLTEKEIEACRKLAAQMGIPLRVRRKAA